MWSPIMKHKWQKVFIKLPAEILPEISLRYNSRSSTLLRDLHYSLTTLFTPTLTSLHIFRALPSILGLRCSWNISPLLSLTKRNRGGG